MIDWLKSALLATGLALTLATPSQAAPVSFDLYVSFANGPLVGSPVDPFLLTILYDDDELTYGDPDDGDGILTPWEGIEILFDGAYVEDLDVDYPDFPEVSFEDYMPVSMDFLIDNLTLPELSFLGLRSIRIGFDPEAGDFFGFVYDPATDSYSTKAFVVAAIPLPAALPLLTLAVGGLVLASRRRARA